MDGVCTATRRDGRPCTVKALPDGSGLCFAHSNRLREQRRCGNAQGGRNKKAEVRASKMLPEVLRPVLFKLLDGLVKVADGRMDPRTGSALAAMASAVVRVYESGMAEEKMRELEERIGDIDRRATRSRGGRHGDASY